MCEIATTATQLLEPDNGGGNLVREGSGEPHRPGLPGLPGPSGWLLLPILGFEGILSHQVATFTGTPKRPQAGDAPESIKEPLSSP
jgi:hypothetical protein